MQLATPAAATETDLRRAVMRLCAEAAPGELETALREVRHEGRMTDLRPPETGLVMLRGRMGGDGAPFNLGEATVTRAAVTACQEPAGEGPGDAREPAIGFAYHLGRDRAKARAAATLDALWQDATRRGAVEAALAPVRDRLAKERDREARQVAATRVDFFTLVRGED